MPGLTFQYSIASPTLMGMGRDADYVLEHLLRPALVVSAEGVSTRCSRLSPTTVRGTSPVTHDFYAAAEALSDQSTPPATGLTCALPGSDRPSFA